MKNEKLQPLGFHAWHTFVSTHHRRAFYKSRNMHNFVSKKLRKICIILCLREYNFLAFQFMFGVEFSSVNDVSGRTGFAIVVIKFHFLK